MIERMDHAVVAVASTADAAAPYQKLGVHVSAPARHAGLGSESRMMFVGESAEQSFFIELFGIFDPVRARASGRAIYLDAIAAGGGLTRVMLKVIGLHALVAKLEQRGLRVTVEEIEMAGRKSSDLAILGAIPEVAMESGLFESVISNEAAFDRRTAAGLLRHDFPLKRVDHLAAITQDIEASTRFWSETLGVPVHGEIRAPGMLIRQLKMGDSILELLAADGAESPLARRRPGLVSMVAWEVPNLDEAVSLARERGFTPTDPAPSVLPGVRGATIPAGELAGLAMQLVEYV